MKNNNSIHAEEYSDIDYLQFNASPVFRFMQKLLGVLSWPFVLPLVLVSRMSELLFRSISEFISLVPYFPGIIVRYEFYRFALKRCGENVLIEFGSIFIHPDVEIGSNVLIGRFNIIHHCDFGNYVLVGERCTFLSGSKQHNSESLNKPMALQGGRKKRIKVGDDCWIGSHCVIAENVGQGSIVGAGTVVVKPIPPYSKARSAVLQVFGRQVSPHEQS
jgi:acetyltransferase-like isoleucine patch superfamily enzyme